MIDETIKQIYEDVYKNWAKSVAPKGMKLLKEYFDDFFSDFENKLQRDHLNHFFCKPEETFSENEICVKWTIIFEAGALGRDSPGLSDGNF